MGGWDDDGDLDAVLHLQDTPLDTKYERHEDELDKANDKDEIKIPSIADMNGPAVEPAPRILQAGWDDEVNLEIPISLEPQDIKGSIDIVEPGRLAKDEEQIAFPVTEPATQTNDKETIVLPVPTAQGWDDELFDLPPVADPIPSVSAEADLDRHIPPAAQFPADDLQDAEASIFIANEPTALFVKEEPLPVPVCLPASALQQGWLEDDLDLGSSLDDTHIEAEDFPSAATDKPALVEQEPVRSGFRALFDKLAIKEDDENDEDGGDEFGSYAEPAEAIPTRPENSAVQDIDEAKEVFVDDPSGAPTSLSIFANVHQDETEQEDKIESEIETDKVAIFSGHCMTMQEPVPFTLSVEVQADQPVDENEDADIPVLPEDDTEPEVKGVESHDGESQESTTNIDIVQEKFESEQPNVASHVPESSSPVETAHLEAALPIFQNSGRLEGDEEAIEVAVDDPEFEEDMRKADVEDGPEQDAEQITSIDNPILDDIQPHPTMPVDMDLAEPVLGGLPLTMPANMDVGWLEDDLDLPDLPSLEDVRYEPTEPMEKPKVRSDSFGDFVQSTAVETEPRVVVDSAIETQHRVEVDSAVETPDPPSVAPSQAQLRHGMETSTDEVSERTPTTERKPQDFVPQESMEMELTGSYSDAASLEEIPFPRRSLYEDFPHPATAASVVDGNPNVISAADFAQAAPIASGWENDDDLDLDLEHLPVDDVESEEDKHEDGEAREDDEDEAVSPTQWFSGLVKTIGSDLKSKTSKGLDRIYGALEATGPIVLAEEPSAEEDASASTEKLRAVVEKMTSPVESPLNSEFKTLFDGTKASGMATAVDLGRRLGTSTIQLASKTKDRLAPTVTELASKVKRKITEMPKRIIRSEDLDAGLRQILFKDLEVMEALETIQIASCKASIRIKRWCKQAGKQAPELFRDDPAASPDGPRLNSYEGWSALEEDTGISFPEDIKARFIRVFLLAEQASESLMESFAALESVPEQLSPDLYQRLLLYTFRSLVAEFVAASLELYSRLASASLSDNAITSLCYSLLAELAVINALAAIPQPDITLTFPELSDEDAENAAMEISKTLDTNSMVSILREVYYAFEPIVIAASLH